MATTPASRASGATSRSNDTAFSSSSSLMDRLTFVLTIDETRNEHVWWPAWLFTNTSEMFQELPHLTTQQKADIFVEYMKVVKSRPNQAQQHVAYFIGNSVPGSCQTLHGCESKSFWNNVSEVTLTCSEYPGWQEACLEAVELSKGGGANSTVQVPTTLPSATRKRAPDAAAKSARKSSAVPPQLTVATPKAPLTNKKRKDIVSANRVASKKTKASAPKSPPSTASGKSVASLAVVTPDPHRHERIPTFQQVKRLLQEAGCTFRKDVYALPKMDPQVNSNAVLGRDYFCTLAEFRANLCAFGMDYDASWRADEREMLGMWIRYSIVTGLEEGDNVPILDGLDDKQAWKLLQKLGFSYAFGGYLKPNVIRKQHYEIPGPLQSKFRDRIGYDGLYAHLARFGLPATTTALTRHELLSLQLYVASGDYPETFIRRHDDDDYLGSAPTFASAVTATPKQSSWPPSHRCTTSPKHDTSVACASNKAHPKPPPSSSDDDLVEVPTFGDVRPLLEKVDFVFRESLYARPGMDPAVNSSSEKGKDYFDSEQEFRKHLCAYGIGVDSSSFNVEEQGTLRDWVSFAIVTALEGHSTIPPQKQMKKASPWGLLHKVGYTFSSTQYCYFSPGVDVRSIKCTEIGQHQNQFGGLGNRNGLYNHLARFGVRGDLSKLSTSDLLSLQLYISSCHVDSIFALKGDGSELLPVPRTASAGASSLSPAVVRERKSRGTRDSSESTVNHVASVSVNQSTEDAADASSAELETSPSENDAIADCPQSGIGCEDGMPPHNASAVIEMGTTVVTKEEHC